jgi:hypothetical protein
MDILDLLRSKAVNPRRVAATKGGEYHSACPRCGGRDRFHAWPAQGDGGTWWCRNCDHGGDLIEFLRHFDNLSYPEALKHLGLERQREYRGLPRAPRRESAESFRGVSRDLPPPLWRTKAAKLAESANGHLLGLLSAGLAGRQSPVVEWLEKRGLGLGAIIDYRLGWLPGEGEKLCYWRPRSAWGLPDLHEDKNGRETVKKRIWIPRGLAIPTVVNGEVLALRIRLTKEDRARLNFDNPYYVVPGSAALPLAAVQARVGEIPGGPRAWVVVESQLDAMLVAGRCAGGPRPLPVGAAAMLSNTGKPDPALHQKLAAAELILLALDYDQPGWKGADWWLKNYPRARRWPVPEGKDPGEYFALGGDIRQWIEKGLPAGLR